MACHQAGRKVACHQAGHKLACLDLCSQVLRRSLGQHPAEQQVQTYKFSRLRTGERQTLAMQAQQGIISSSSQLLVLVSTAGYQQVTMLA